MQTAHHHRHTMISEKRSDSVSLMTLSGVAGKHSKINVFIDSAKGIQPLDIPIQELMV